MPSLDPRPAVAAKFRAAATALAELADAAESSPPAVVPALAQLADNVAELTPVVADATARVRAFEAHQVRTRGRRR
jgi:hypothetical protein